MIGTIRQIDRQQLAALLTRPWARRIASVHVQHTWRPAHADWRGEATVDAMRRFHMDVLRWSNIGQHLTVGPDGSLWTGRDLDQPPASAAGHNGSAQEGPLMIALVGDFDRGRDVFTGFQAEEAYSAIATICARFALSPDAIRFLSEFNAAKTSPGTGIVLADFRVEVGKRMGARSRSTRAALPDPEAAATYLAQFGQAKAPGAARAPADTEPAELRFDAAQAAYDWRAVPAARLFGQCECSDAEREIFRSHVVDLAMGQLSHDGCYNNAESDLDELVARIGTWIDGAAKPRLCSLPTADSSTKAAASGSRSAIAAGGSPTASTPCSSSGKQASSKCSSKSSANSRRATSSPTRAMRCSKSPSDRPPASRPGTGSRPARCCRRPPRPRPVFRAARIRFAAKLAARLKTHAATPGAKPVGLHAVGHSAGAIFHCHYLPALLAALAAAGLPKPRIDTVALLAPAARVDLFKSHLKPLLPKGIAQFALFTMDRPTELADNVATVYRKSLLYFVRNACEEPVHATPILGLEESVRADADLAQWFGLNGGAPAAGVDVAWSPTAAVSGPSATRSRTHGGFDNDAPTMNSVMYRILALPATDDLPLPHLGETEVSVCGKTMRGLALPGAGATTGPNRSCRQCREPARRRALTIGINAYPAQPLGGCVADARGAGAALAQLGFDVKALYDEAATRQGIAAAIEGLLAESRRGDTVVIHYAGHGTQLPDLNQDEGDGFDEAWVPIDYLSGEFFIDDDQGALFDRYRDAGIELVLFTDCCHSGTNTRAAFSRNAPQTRANSRYLAAPPDAVRRFRELRGGATRVAATGPAKADALGWEIHYSACRDTQSAYEHDGQGDFTRALTALLGDVANQRRELPGPRHPAGRPVRKQRPAIAGISRTAASADRGAVRRERARRGHHDGRGFGRCAGGRDCDPGPGAADRRHRCEARCPDAQVRPTLTGTSHRASRLRTRRARTDTRVLGALRAQAR